MCVTKDEGIGTTDAAYYHTDHLGSSSVITDSTGLYYYGARSTGEAFVNGNSGGFTNSSGSGRNGLSDFMGRWPELVLDPGWVMRNILEPISNTITQPGYNSGMWAYGEKSFGNLFGAFLDSAWAVSGVYGAMGVAAASRAVSRIDDAAGAGKVIKVIGRQRDTAVAKGWAGHDVLDLPQGRWTSQKNALWVDEGIKNRQPFYKASPETNTNIWKTGTSKTIYGQELDRVRAAGYKDAGDYLLP